MIQETTLTSFFKLKEEGTLSRMEARIFEAIKKHPCLCDREYSDILELRINQVTARRNGLAKKELIINTGKKYDSITGSEAMMWRIR